MRTSKWLTGAILALLSALLLPTNASATIVIALDQQKLARDADAVVLGKVLSLQSYREKDGSIWTATRIQLEKVLRGRITDKVMVLKQPGGKINEWLRTIPGISVFSPNERVLVFLEAHPTRTHVVMGMAQGKFSVIQDPKSKRWIAYRNLDNLTLVNRANSGRLTVVSPIQVKPYFFLDDLIKMVISPKTK